MNFKTRELGFNLKDKNHFNEAAVKAALEEQKFANVKLKVWRKPEKPAEKQ
jgi:hypothetical protein